MQALAKAQMQRLTAAGGVQGPPIDVLFNPTEYTLSKANQFAEIPVPGLDSPLLQFVRGQAETLTLDLFFDTTDKGTGMEAQPVTAKTDPFYQLIKIQAEEHAPPIVLFSWGGEAFPGHRTYESLAGQNRYGFKGVVESVRQRFTMFSSLGLPLRAVISMVMKEYKSLPEQLAELNRMSPDRAKAHVVQQGQTISQIAYLTGDDPTQWRRIAEWNGLEDPFDIEPGAVIEAPPVSARGAVR